MMTFLFAMQMMTAQPSVDPAPDAPRTLRIDVVLYQGDPSGKQQNRTKLISPQLITLDGQTAVISQGLEVTLPSLQPGDSSPTVEPRCPGTVDATITLTPHSLRNGDVILTGSIKTSEIIANSKEIQHKVERDVRLTLTCKPSETVTIPLYNPGDYRETIASSWDHPENNVTTIKPFTGREMWVELKVCQHKPEK